MNNFVHRALCKNYETTAKAMLKEYRKNHTALAVDTSETATAYKEALETLRLFLDAEGMPMPHPKWHYNPHDKSTWLYGADQKFNKDFLFLRRKRKNDTMEAHT